MGAAVSIPLRAKTHRFALLQVSLTLPATMFLSLLIASTPSCVLPRRFARTVTLNLEKPLRPLLGWSLNHQPT
jgi:hypothetical protein